MSERYVSQILESREGCAEHKIRFEAKRTALSGDLTFDKTVIAASEAAGMAAGGVADVLFQEIPVKTSLEKDPEFIKKVEGIELKFRLPENAEDLEREIMIIRQRFESWMARYDIQVYVDPV